jgi:hypothetical protein
VSNCHAGAAVSSSGALDLSGDAFAALVNVPAENATAKSSGLLRVRPGDPEHSFLYLKLTLSYPGASPSQQGLSPRNGGRCTGMCDRMPAGVAQPPLDALLVQTIRNWIAAGAQP